MVLHMLAHCHGLLGHLKRTELPQSNTCFFSKYDQSKCLLMKRLDCIYPVASLSSCQESFLFTCWCVQVRVRHVTMQYLRFVQHTWIHKVHFTKMDTEERIVDPSFLFSSLSSLGCRLFPHKYSSCIHSFYLCHCIKRDISFFFFSVEFSFKEPKWMNTIRR